MLGLAGLAGLAGFVGLAGLAVFIGIPQQKIVLGCFVAMSASGPFSFHGSFLNDGSVDGKWPGMPGAQREVHRVRLAK